MTAADIARVLDVTPQAVSYWETGQKVPSVKHALAYGRALEALERKAAPRGHFPVPVPDYVKDRMRTFFKPEPADILSRPAALFDGKSAVHWVADGDGTWDQVLAAYDQLFGWQVPL